MFWRRDKYYDINDKYEIVISFWKNNALFDILFCKDNHLCVGDTFPFWYFSFSLLKFKIEIRAKIF